MKIIFVSGAYSDNNLELLNKATRRNLQIASHVFQQGIVTGLIENDADFEVVSAPFLPSFPFYNSLLINPSSSYCYNGKIVGKSIKFCTLLGWKERSISYNLFKELKNIIDKNKDVGNIALLIYSPYGPFLEAAAKLKKIFPSITIGLIVTDRFCNSLKRLQELTWKNKIRLYQETRKIENNISCVNKYILLAERLTEYVTNSQNDHIVVEGIYDGFGKLDHISKGRTPKILLYSGSLDVHTSIKELIDAFLLTKQSDFVLQICGNGLYADYVRKAALGDRRINYMGVVNREEVLKLQKQATALINPRMPFIDDTPYSFPSKTMEYLASGTPMIGYRLEGIPKEYYSFFYQIDEPTIESMAQTIEAILNKPQEELNQKAIEAFDFIVNNKTAREQVRKILNYLE